MKIICNYSPHKYLPKNLIKSLTGFWRWKIKIVQPGFNLGFIGTPIRVVWISHSARDIDLKKSVYSALG